VAYGSPAFHFSRTIFINSALEFYALQVLERVQNEDENVLQLET
jgi:hypothetical protein